MIEFRKWIELEAIDTLAKSHDRRKKIKKRKDILEAFDWLK